MTKKEIEQKIAFLHEQIFNAQKEIEALESEAVKMQDTKKWPKLGDFNFYHTSDGSIRYGTWYDSDSENLRLSIGNCYRYEADAKFAVERMKVLAEMRKYACNDDDPDEPRITITYNPDVPWDFLYVSLNYNFGAPRFDSEEAARACVAAIGEGRLKKYWFGVNDGI